VLRLGQDRDHFILGQGIERSYYREASNKFGNHSERQQIFRLNMANGFFPGCFFNLQRWASETHHFVADTFLDDFVEADKCATTNKQNFFRVNLDVFLVRMLSSTLWRNIAGA